MIALKRFISIMQFYNFLFDRDTINSIKNTLPCMGNISNQSVTDSFDLNYMMSYLKILHEHYAAILPLYFCDLLFD